MRSGFGSIVIVLAELLNRQANLKVLTYYIETVNRIMYFVG